jgi:hypothetical protein
MQRQFDYFLHSGNLYDLDQRAILYQIFVLLKGLQYSHIP